MWDMEKWKFQFLTDSAKSLSPLFFSPFRSPSNFPGIAHTTPHLTKLLKKFHIMLASGIKTFLHRTVKTMFPYILLSSKLRKLIPFYEWSLFGKTRREKQLLLCSFAVTEPSTNFSLFLLWCIARLEISAQPRKGLFVQSVSSIYKRNGLDSSAL